MHPNICRGAYSEAGKTIEQYGWGYTSLPGDYLAIEKNIEKLISLSDEEYMQIKRNCFEASKTTFDFEEQMGGIGEFLKERCGAD